MCEVYNARIRRSMIAQADIRKQPFFKTKREQWGTGARTAAWAAREMLKHVKTMQRSSVFVWNGPLQRIRRQPFFGVDSSLPTTVKFRRPVLYQAAKEVIEIGEIGDRTAKYSVPVKRCPIYSLRDICWDSKPQNY